MWRLEWVGKCGRTAHEMVVVIKYIYTHLFTKGSSSPRHVPKHTTHTYRPYSQVLQYSVPWAPVCPKVQSQAPVRPKPGPNLGTETHLKLSTITIQGTQTRYRDKAHRKGTQNKAYKTREQNEAKSVHASRHVLFHTTPVYGESSTLVFSPKVCSPAVVPLLASLSPSLLIRHPFKYTGHLAKLVQSIILGLFHCCGGTWNQPLRWGSQS